ncbi:MAG TPA: DUF1802 family protein [Thermoanaerobaculia bacterium]|nr:DUF1802 family protein [Thermoanaerobaculia bacterium]
MKKIENHTALKEWAAVISALAAGDQVLLVRKGGIADQRFGVDARRFYLFPTYLHQKERQFKPWAFEHFHRTDRLDAEPERVEIEVWAEVERVLHIGELAALRQLDPLVIFTTETIEERYRFRPDQAVHVILLRVYRLPMPATVMNRTEYAGCRSWISIEEEIDLEGSVAVLDEQTFARRVDEVERLLGTPRPATVPIGS